MLLDLAGGWGAGPQDDLNDFPVPVRLNPATIDYAATAANDLTFYNEDQTTRLPYEIEKWDPQGESIVWVKIPVLHASGANQVWLYYGGSSFADAQPRQVWDPNFLVVYHFGERIEDYFTQPGAVKQHLDSTANDNAGLRQAANASSSGPSYTLESKDPRYNMVGRYYESHRGYVRAKNGLIGDGARQFTLSAWVRANEAEYTTLNYPVISRKRSGDALNQAYMLKIAGGRWSANLFTGDADASKNGSQAGAELDGGAATAEWTYFTLTYDQALLGGGNLKMYRDGVLVDSKTRAGSIITTSGTSTAPFTISKASDATAAGGGYRGGVDEVRVSKVARSAAWVQAEYQSMVKNSSFVSFGERQHRKALQVTMLQPKNGEVYNTPDLSIVAMVNEHAVVRYRLDGGEAVNLEGSAASSVFQAALKGLKQGTHQLHVEAVSAKDPSVSDSRSVTFTVDGDKLSPSVVPEGADGMLAQQGGSVPLRVKAESPVGAPVDVSFYEKNVQFVKDYRTKASGDIAYERTDSMDPPANAAITSETPLPVSAYEQLGTSADGTYYSSKSLLNYPYQRFDLTIDQNLSDKDELEVSWEGHSKDKVLLYALNYSTNKWELLATRNGNSDNRDFKLTGMLNKATMVDGATKVAKLYVAATQPDTMLPGRKPLPEEYDFSFVWMTDTQLEAESFPGVYDASTQWIADHKEEQKIKYVIHTGDIVNTASSEKQWKNADHSMKILEKANVPYGVLEGNHDVGTPYYAQYFGANRFRDKPYYGQYSNSNGEYSSNNKNHYDLISAGGVDFIILYMGWQGMNTESVNWANQVLQQYKDRKAILSVHEYLLYSGTYGTDDYGGKKIMNQIVQPNSNVFMVLCGHNQSAYYNVKRIGGKIVYELLHDYQDAALGGAGYIRMMYFDLKKQLMYMVPYSPITDDNYGFFQQKHENYTIPLNFSKEPIELATDYIGVKGSKPKLLGEGPAAPNTGMAEYVWGLREANKPYTWYAVAKNANSGIEVKSQERTFTIAEPVVQSIRLGGLKPMKIGETQSAVVEATYTDGRLAPALGYIIISSRPEVARVNVNGSITALSGGETVITAMLGSLTASYRLLIQANESAPPSVKSIELSGLRGATEGEVLQAGVSAAYSDGSSSFLLEPGKAPLPGLILTTSDPRVAELEAGTGKVKTLQAGQTVIEATYRELRSSYTLLVRAVPQPEAPKLQGIVLEGVQSLKMGQQGKANVFGLYGPAAVKEPIVDDLQWTSSYQAVAMVDVEGMLTPLKPGKSTITVWYKGWETSAELTVLAADNSGNSGGNGNGGGIGNGSSSGGTSGSPIPAPGPSGLPGAVDPAFIQTVLPSHLVVTGNKGVSQVKVEAGKSQVELPYALIPELRSDQLALQFGWGTLTVPVRSLQMERTSPTGTRKDQTSLVVSYRTWDDDLLEVLTELQKNSAVNVEPLAHMLHVAWNDPASVGQTAELRLPLPPQAHAKRLGLYRVTGDGSVRLQSPNRSQSASEAIFTLSGGGDYVVLDYSIRYPDVANHWSADVVGDLAARRMFSSMVAEPIVSGSGPQSFYPEKPVTRAEFAALLARSLELPKGAPSAFTDLPTTAWYTQEVAAALQAGIVQGVSEREFVPDALITREQMAAMLMRAWNFTHKDATKASSEAAFADWNDVSEWAKEYVVSAAALRLLNGREEGSFVPKGNATRAEAAQVIHNYLFIPEGR
nr:DUF2341 domain-containing protein [Paenibacillus sp. SYP-B3998]